MAEMYLIRHAQASFGSANYDKLSELGHRQSRLLGEYFKARDLNFEHVVTGDMQRHRETALGIVGAEQALVTDPGWNEYDFQAVIDAYLRVHPEQKPIKNAPRSDWYRVLKAAMLSWSRQELEGLDEYWSDFESRVSRAAQSVFTSGKKRVLVVSSGGAIGVCLMQMLGVSVEKAIDFNLQIKNTSIHHFYFNEKSAQLSSFNNVPHLDHPQHHHLISYS
ncbi:histidine phosphatase family protein [Ningiella sp. W23]|uniref:histidine phosphatase family protein n=1 Tax=Ningiella sp. W23 TaxID=3023715 RepID=UPI0037581DC5